MSRNHQDHECRQSKACKPFGKYGPEWTYTIDCAKQATWNKKMAKLLTKEPPSTAVLRRAPQGEVT